MNIELSGHHVDITEAMKNITIKKFSKLEKKYPALIAITIIVTADRNTQHVEAKTQYLGAPLNVSAKNKDFYAAIDQAATKLDRSLNSRKGHIDTIGREKLDLVDMDEADESEINGS